MAIEQIVRAERVSRVPPGDSAVREFAAREFPQEESLWVAAAFERTPARVRPRWGIFRGRGIRRRPVPGPEPESEPLSGRKPA